MAALRHVEALFEKKQTSEQSLTRVGIRRRITLNGRRRVCLNDRGDGKYTADLRDSESRNPRQFPFATSTGGDKLAP
jgi:hypothetical protein